MIKRLFLLFLVLSVSVGFAGVPTLNTGIDRRAARTDASNITATDTFRGVLGAARLGGELTQSFKAKDLTMAGFFSHSVTANGYTIYQGNTAFSAAGEDSVTLPVDVASATIPVTTGTSGYVIADIVGTNATDSSSVYVHLTGSYNKFGGTLAWAGSPASTTNQLNAATWSASLTLTGNVFGAVATGTVGTEWQVKKFEIGGL